MLNINSNYIKQLHLYDYYAKFSKNFLDDFMHGNYYAFDLDSWVFDNYGIIIDYVNVTINFTDNAKMVEFLLIFG